MPSIVCGPGHMDVAHKPDEYVDLAQLVLAPHFLEDVGRRDQRHLNQAENVRCTIPFDDERHPSIEIQKPDLEPYREGSSTEFPTSSSMEAGQAGPHAVITALVHGNELSGAWALITLLQQEIRPKRGRLVAGCSSTSRLSERFDPAQPKASRYLDHDFNRLWDARRLDSMERSRELDRAREFRR